MDNEQTCKNCGKKIEPPRQYCNKHCLSEYKYKENLKKKLSDVESRKEQNLIRIKHWYYHGPNELVTFAFFILVCFVWYRVFFEGTLYFLNEVYSGLNKDIAVVLVVFFVSLLGFIGLKHLFFVWFKKNGYIDNYTTFAFFLIILISRFSYDQLVKIEGITLERKLTLMIGLFTLSIYTIFAGMYYLRRLVRND